MRRMTPFKWVAYWTSFFGAPAFGIFCYLRGASWLKSLLLVPVAWLVLVLVFAKFSGLLVAFWKPKVFQTEEEEIRDGLRLLEKSLKR